MSTTETLRQLRQPRYFAFSLLMVVVALVCIVAGTWQIARLEQKVSANDLLRNNAHAKPVPVSALLPKVGLPSPASHAIEYRTVWARGTYDATHQSLVRNRDLNGDTGWYVLTPFNTDGAVLLVARGFVSDSAVAAGTTPTPPAPPQNTVTITGQARAAETRPDRAAELTNAQVESINPTEQQARLGGTLYDGYIQLGSGQPGTANLTDFGQPDLSNPAGGAVEPQHFAYVIQWYLFAILAVAAPFVMVRAESRGLPEDEDAELTPEQQREARLADRYGRPR